MNLKLDIAKKLKSLKEFQALPGNKRANYAFLIGSLTTNFETMMSHAKCQVEIVRSETINKKFKYSKKEINFYVPLLSNKFKLWVRLHSEYAFYDTDYIFAQSAFVIYCEAINTIDIEWIGLTYSLLEHMEHLLISGYISLIASSFWKNDFDDSDIFDKLSQRHYEGHPAELSVSIKPNIKTTNSVPDREKVYLDPDLLTSKKTRRLFTGHRTIMECDKNGQLIDIKCLAPVSDSPRKGSLYLAPYEYQPLFAYSVRNKSLCFVLNRHGDTMILIDGNLLAMRRENTWRIFSSRNFLDHISSALNKIKRRRSSKKDLLMLSIYLGIICFSLRNRRKGGLIVISDKTRINKLIPSETADKKPVEILYQKLIADKHVVQIPFELLCNAISVDGASLIEIDGKFVKYGVVLNTPFSKSNSEGARTKAAEHASNYGLAIKISEDGPITLYSKSKMIYQVE